MRRRSDDDCSSHVGTQYAATSSCAYECHLSLGMFGIVFIFALDNITTESSNSQQGCHFTPGGTFAYLEPTFVSRTRHIVETSPSFVGLDYLIGCNLLTVFFLIKVFTHVQLQRRS